MRDVIQYVVLSLVVLLLLLDKCSSNDRFNKLFNKIETQQLKIDSAVGKISNDTVLVINDYVIKQDFSPINKVLSDSYLKLMFQLENTFKGKINDTLFLSLQHIAEQYRYEVDSNVIKQQEILIGALRDSLQYIKDNPPILFDKKSVEYSYDLDDLSLDVTTEYYGSIVHQYVSGTMERNISLNNISILSKGMTNFNGQSDLSIGLYYQRKDWGLGFSRSLNYGNYELFLSKQLKSW